MKSKIAALFAILVIGLGVAGAAYAAWTATLTINGTVETGDFDVSIEASEVSDNNDVATVTVSGPGSSISIDVDNAYPGCTGEVEITITNTGTVPVEISGVTADPGSSLADWTLSGNAPAVGDEIAPSGTQIFNVQWSIPGSAPEGDSDMFTINIAFGLPT